MLSAEEFESIRLRLSKAIKAPVKSKRIRAIKVNSAEHWQPPLYIEVGKRCADLEWNAPVQTIVAILEGPSFMVCTAGRGIDNNLPYFFARTDVRRVDEFNEWD